MPDRDDSLTTASRAERARARVQDALDRRAEANARAAGAATRAGLAPTKVTTLVATPGTQKIDLTWDQSQALDLQYYEVQYSTAATFSSPTTVRVPSTQPYWSLELGQATGTDPYSFRARGVNRAGYGPWSDTVTSAIGQTERVDVLDDAITERDLDNLSTPTAYDGTTWHTIGTLTPTLSETNGDSVRIIVSGRLDPASANGVDGRLVRTNAPDTGDDLVIWTLSPLQKDTAGTNRIWTIVFEYAPDQGDGVYTLEFQVTSRSGGAGTATVQFNYFSYLNIFK